MGRLPCPDAAGDQQFATVHAHRVPKRQLAAAPQLDGSVDAHVAPLDAQLGLATGGRQAMELEELIKLQGS